MKQVLHIISSPKADGSMSRILGKKVIQNIKTKYPEAYITEYDLSKIQMPHLKASHINAFFTPDDKITQAEEEERAVSDHAVKELLKADIVVVEAPMYNWNIPSSLKAYFDQIARAGITFKYEYKGDSLLPTGLLQGKKAYIVTSSGGVYSEGKLKDFDFTTNYVKFFLEVLGMEVVDIFRAEGQSTLGKEEALKKGVDSILIA